MIRWDTLVQESMFDRAVVDIYLESMISEAVPNLLSSVTPHLEVLVNFIFRTVDHGALNRKGYNSFQLLSLVHFTHLCSSIAV